MTHYDSIKPDLMTDAQVEQGIMISGNQALHIDSVVSRLNECTHVVDKNGLYVFTPPNAQENFAFAEELLRTALADDDLAIQDGKLYLSTNAARQLQSKGLKVDVPARHEQKAPWLERVRIGQHRSEAKPGPAAALPADYAARLAAQSQGVQRYSAMDEDDEPGTSFER